MKIAMICDQKSNFNLFLYLFNNTTVITDPLRNLMYFHRKTNRKSLIMIVIISILKKKDVIVFFYNVILQNTYNNFLIHRFVVLNFHKYSSFDVRIHKCI